ncbi:hypothetical protein DPMN_127594 [Dreissena polymorpha]|uniref:Short-chain collagen C4-like n=1 Tax=Dreissena polymorpha TaxID=45954 RepID=A0A9D4GZ86_DREPO|nr:hypothetical protein DPMN_127594 [Dreissena polymorpha]
MYLDTNAALNSTVRKQNVFTYIRYIRWGRKACPNITTTSLVYTGQAASGHYGQPGSAEYLCLPNDPQFYDVESAEQGARSLIYGSEYETPTTAFTTLNSMEVPCALCLSRGKTTIMIPARTSCYSGWTLECRGYLMSSEASQPGKNYVCMDINAEALDASHGNLDQALFYLVEGRCSALKCPPYVH